MLQNRDAGRWLEDRHRVPCGRQRLRRCRVATPFAVWLLLGQMLAAAQTVDDARQPPQVIFSREHAQTNRVQVGDRFPAAALTGLDGQRVDWQCPDDGKWTVILVCNQQLAAGREAYRLFASRLVIPFAAQGVRGIAVHCDDPAPVVAEAVASHGAGIDNWLDTDDSLWSQIATDILPRLYLLDSDGKILWMDIEFSQGTQRDLLHALEHFGSGNRP